MSKISYLNKLKEELNYNLRTGNDEKTAKIAHELADEFNDPRYQGFLGAFYKPSSLIKAIKYFKKSVEQGYIKSGIELAKIYAYKNDPKGLEDLANTIDKFDHNYVFYIKILKAYILKNEKEIDKIINDCIKYNSTQIILVLRTAVHYYENKQEYKKSFKLLKLLEKYYDSTSYYRIAQYYKEGKGVESDFDKYFEYLVIANDGASNFEIGVMYLFGQNLEIDYKKALFYFDCSYKKGYKLSPFGIAMVYGSKDCKFYSNAKSDKWMEVFFKANANDLSMINNVRNYMVTLEDKETKDYLKKMMKKYWKVEEFEA